MYDIKGFFEWLEYGYNPDEWRLFIDSSKSSLKICLLINKSKQKQDDLPVVPILYSTTLKENVEHMKLVLDLIDYEGHKWTNYNFFNL